jgi:hypothetical protein
VGGDCGRFEWALRWWQGACFCVPHRVRPKRWCLQRYSRRERHSVEVVPTLKGESDNPIRPALSGGAELGGASPLYRRPSQPRDSARRSFLGEQRPLSSELGMA